MKTKFNINRKKLSDSEIDNYQDFDKLMQNYTALAKPFYQTKWFWGGAGAAAVIATVVYLYVYLHTYKNVETTELAKDSLATATTEMPFINPPMKGIDVPFESYTIDAHKGGEITHKTGSKLIIPANCFRDEKGNVIKGEVKIRYREFHDVVDFFASGIPMTYDSAGTQYTFESAGMIEIQGYLNEKPIAIAEGKSIDVKMLSDYEGTKYNLYYLDTAAKNWDCLGKDRVSSESVSEVSGLDTITFETPETDATIETIKTPAEEKLETLKEKPLPIEPAKPAKAKSENYSFNLDVNNKEFPELAIYKDVLFEIHPKHKDFDPKLYEIQWEDALLKKLNGENNYELTLVKGETKKTFSVYPVFEGKQFEEAKKIYDKKYQEYTTTLDARKAEEKRLKEEAEKQRQEAIAKWEAQKKEWEEKQKKVAQSWASITNTQQKVIREFSINGFGVYNCDSPQMFPKGAELSPCVYEDKNGNDLVKQYAVYITPWLVDKNRNAIFSGALKLKFNPQAENILWMALPDNKLAIFRPEDFKQMNKTSGSYTFKMDVVEVSNIQQMKQVLEI